MMLTGLLSHVTDAETHGWHIVYELGNMSCRRLQVFVGPIFFSGFLLCAWALCAQVSSNAPPPIEPKQRADIQNACATTLTNIRTELTGLSGKFPVLAGVESAQIRDHGYAPPVGFDLVFQKNFHFPPNTNLNTNPLITRLQQTGPETETPVLDPGGFDLVVEIHDADAMFPGAGVPVVISLPGMNGTTRREYLVSYRLQLKEQNPDLDKAVKAVVDQQTAILKTNLLNLMNAGTNP
jgi:hypothetical protein